jgi:hypothetical protein
LLLLVLLLRQDRCLDPSLTPHKQLHLTAFQQQSQQLQLLHVYCHHHQALAFCCLVLGAALSDAPVPLEPDVAAAAADAPLCCDVP